MLQHAAFVNAGGGKALVKVQAADSVKFVRALIMDSETGRVYALGHFLLWQAHLLRRNARM